MIVSIYEFNGNLQLQQKFNKVKSAPVNISRLRGGTYFIDTSDGKT